MAHAVGCSRVSNRLLGLTIPRGRVVCFSSELSEGCLQCFHINMDVAANFSSTIRRYNNNLCRATALCRCVEQLLIRVGCYILM